MALAHINNAESASSGTAVDNINSGGTDADVFNAVVVGTSCTLTFDNTHAAHGTNGFKLAIGATDAATYMAWTGLGAVTEMWGAVSFYFTANPSSSLRSIAFFSGGGLLGNLCAVSNGGLLQWKFPSDTSVGTNNNTAVTLNQYNRIEFHIIFNASTGSGEAQWYPGDSVTQTGTSSTFTATNTGASCDEIRIGLNAASTTINYTYWLDDFKLSPTGYPGPGPYTSASIRYPDTFTAIPFQAAGRNL
jgi:hypothetical protein